MKHQQNVEYEKKIRSTMGGIPYIQQMFAHLLLEQLYGKGAYERVVFFSIFIDPLTNEVGVGSPVRIWTRNEFISIVNQILNTLDKGFFRIEAER